MASLIVVKNADFSSVALDKVNVGSIAWVENNFTWGKGGISDKGTSSGSTNHAMSVIAPMPYASNKVVLKAANGYYFHGLLKDTTNSNTHTSDYLFTSWTANDCPDTIEIPAGFYYQVSIAKLNGTNADLADAHSSLLIQQISY